LRLVAPEGDKCSYLDEPWKGKEPGQSPLQKQIGRVFELVGQAWGRSSAEELLRTSISGNLVPFRSPKWNTLRCQKECIALGQLLWKEVLDRTRPLLVITMTSRTARAILAAYGLAPRYDARPSGWGNVTWRA